MRIPQNVNCMKLTEFELLLILLLLPVFLLLEPFVQRPGVISLLWTF